MSNFFLKKLPKNFQMAEIKKEFQDFSYLAKVRNEVFSAIPLQTAAL